MTLGKKIAILRISRNLSQESFGEYLNVSRQSVSKWETDLSVPSLDKIVEISDLFSVPADLLLREDRQLPAETALATPTPTGGNKYFGTDGFRGEANETLTVEQAYRVGRFLGWYFSKNSLERRKPQNGRARIVIGKDTRRSSYALEYALVAGLTASGADAYMLHVTTTPSVSYITRQDNFDCGIMITASHNPFFDNGIKIMSGYGEKLDDKTTSLIEAYLDGNLARLGFPGGDLPLAKKEKIGQIVDYVAGRNRYIGYLISLASHSYKNLRIGLDCANGASWNIAKSVFEALGAQVTLIGANPDGVNINDRCGSTHPEALCRAVRENRLDVGFAFDGDADRCIAVDENGEIVDGDKIIYILGVRLKSRGMLDGNTVVATVMSNSGLERALDKVGIACERTSVGDRFVYERMNEKNYCLGGEASGHIILRKYATTGDGLLTAIMLAEEMCDRKESLSAMASPVVLFPQLTVNLKVSDKDGVTHDEKVLSAVDGVTAELNGNGRVILRASGTEPLIRVMVEAPTEKDCEKYAEKIASTIRKGGYVRG